MTETWQLRICEKLNKKKGEFLRSPPRKAPKTSWEE